MAKINIASSAMRPRLFPIARGTRGWTEATADGSVRVYGEPELVGAMPTWFISVKAQLKSERHYRSVVEA